MNQYDDDFWGNDDESTGTVDIGGSFEDIPHNTRCVIHIEDVEWKYFDEKKEGNEDGENIPWVSVKWNIESPVDYENRKLPQKIKYYGDDPKSEYFKPEKEEKTKEKARLVFWAIDKNCGGKIAALKLRRVPTDQELQRYLIGKSMIGIIGVWDINGKTGNYIMKIEPLSSGFQSKSSQKRMDVQSKPQQQRSSNSGFDESDDIPFN